MNGIKRQGGYGTLLLITFLGLVSFGSAYYYETRLNQPNSARENYEAAAEEMRLLTSALTDYYRDNSSWPATLNDLVAGNYFTGDPARCGGGGTLQSPFCTTIFGSQVGDDYNISFNALKKTIADSISNQVPGGARTGVTVSATIQRPFQSALYDDYLQKQTDPLRADRTRAEVDIDVNGNDLLNIGNMNASAVTIASADITVANINTAIAQTINMGGNNIEHSGNELSLNASTVAVNGETSLNGDLQGNGNDITNGDTVDGNSGSFNTFTANSGTIDNLTGDSLNYDAGVIDSVSGNSIDYSTGVINTLDGNSLNFNSGTIDSVTGNSLNFSSGAINNLSGSSINFGSGTVTTLDGTTLTYTNVNGSNGSFSNLTATGAAIGALQVSGNSSFNGLTASSGDVTNLNGTSGSISNLSSSNASISNGSVGIASGSRVKVSGSSSINNLNSSNISSSSFDGGNTTAGSGSVSGNFSAGIVNAGNFSISGALTTGSLNASNSGVGNASASSLTVSGGLTTSGLNVTTANINSANVSSVSASYTNFNSISANTFIGSSFSSNADFVSSDSSVNNNYIQITGQHTKLDNCINTTKYCIPQDPLVSLVCSTCSAAAQRSSFSSTATASINDCRQGCSYRWETSGTKLIFSDCNSGTVPPGGNLAPTCNVSTNLDAQESSSGEITIIVTNARYASKRASQKVNISFNNTTPDIDLDLETSIDCSNCTAYDTGGYKGGSSATASVNLLVSGRLVGVNVNVSISSPQCRSFTTGDKVRVNSNTSTGGGSASLSVRVSDSSAGQSGEIECSAVYRIEISAANANGSKTYSGILTALASTT